MPFISVSDEVAKKSFTSVENKFITKYMPVLEPFAVKVYLYALYLFQNGMYSMTLSDLAHNLKITEDQAVEYFEYLEEFELVSIISSDPVEIKILDAENVIGTPKKFKPEKYSDFTKSVQNVIKGRMISTNEFREYFYLLEEYGFEQNALIMIINYCVNLKGDDIKFAYIKKVAVTFAEEGAVTARKVDEKLSAYSSSTPSLIKLFNAVGIKRQPDIDDDKLFKKWVGELGFEPDAVIVAAKLFKAKTVEKIDGALQELFKNKKFDKKEIEDYCNTKSSVIALTADIAKNLGVYMQSSAPYIENYVNVWCNFGYSHESLKSIANHCFKQGKNSFEDMDSAVKKLYDEGVIDEASVDAYIKEQAAEDKLLRDILNACGLTRKIIAWDRENLARWRSWNFSDAMLFKAAELSSGKANPVAYMNGVLSGWKSEGVFSPDKITSRQNDKRQPTSTAGNNIAEIERHYSELRGIAEDRAESILKKATDDSIYGNIRRTLNELNIKLAFAEIRDKSLAEELKQKIAELEEKGDARLHELGIDKSDFIPHYSCKICSDTGYDRYGKPCSCMIEFLDSLKNNKKSDG